MFSVLFLMVFCYDKGHFPWECLCKLTTLGKLSDLYC